MGLLNLAKLEMPKKEDEPLGAALTKGFQALAKKKKPTDKLDKAVKDSESKSYQASDEDSMA